MRVNNQIQHSIFYLKIERVKGPYICDWITNMNDEANLLLFQEIYCETRFQLPENSTNCFCLFGLELQK